VHVDTAEVHLAVVGAVVDLRAGGWSLLGPPGVVPAVTPQDARRVGERVRADEVEAFA